MKPLPLLALAVAALALPAVAGTAPPDPLDARVVVPPAVYQSPMLRGRIAEVTPVPWREANDRVTRIGGWRVYARETAAPEAAPAPASAPAAAPAPRAASAPTMRHHQHGGPR